MEKDFISVIIATRNEEKNIKNIIDSLREQSDKDFEIIVVDNGSTDRTLEIAKENQVLVFNLAEEISLVGVKNFRGAQVNFGVTKAKGDFIFFPDADMTFESELFSEAIEKLKNNDALYVPEIVCGNGIFGQIRKFERSFYNETVIDAVRFVRREIFEKVGGFDEKNIAFAADDWDLTKMIKKISKKVSITEKSLFHHEEQMHLRKYLKKKGGYADTFADYVKKWGEDDSDIKKQFGFGYRYLGVFLENGKWKKLLRHPLLTLGLYSLRFLVGVIYLLKKIQERSFLKDLFYKKRMLSKKMRLAFKYPKNTWRFLLKKDQFLVCDFPELITFFVTSACNLQCPMCKNSNFRNNVVPNQQIKLSEVEKILPELRKFKPFCYLVGGEPLLNVESLPIIKLLSQNKIFTSMTSNGFLLEDFAEDICHSGLEFLSLSLDHFDEGLHDNGRGVSGVYKNLLTGLKIINKSRKITGTPSNIKINTVIRKDNIAELSLMYDFIEKLGIDEWQLSHFAFKNPQAQEKIAKFKVEKGFGDNSLGLDIGTTEYLNCDEIETLKKQLRQIKEKSKKYKTKAFVPTIVDDLTKYYQGAFPSKNSRCAAPFNSMQVYGNGIVKAGCLDVAIGNCLEGDSLYSVWHSERNKNFQKLIKEQKVLPPCFRCHALSYYWHEQEK
ncbi:MAG: glycosyltransferase [Patescibacteria group bacterium]